MMVAPTAVPLASDRRRWRALVGIALVAFLSLVAVLLVISPNGASADEIAFEQCNGIGGGGGQTVECDVVIVNTLTGNPGTTGSTVSINGGTPVASSDIIVSVTQCNGSANGGGSILACSVDITNIIAIDGAAGAGQISVNQCNANQPDGLGTAPATCNPSPATTSGAVVTQCNGSGDGGGLIATSGCDASGTFSASLIVLVDQCNGSANGGGSAVNCSVTMDTIVTDTTPTPTPTATASPTATPEGTPSEGGGTPSEGGGTPSEGGGTPSEGEGTPSEGGGTPSEGEGTPPDLTTPPGAPGFTG